MENKQLIYRIKYGDLRTGLMSKTSAEAIAENLKKTHEQVGVYIDDELENYLRAVKSS